MKRMKRLLCWLIMAIACPIHGWPEYRTATGNKGCWECRRAAVGADK